MLNKISLIDEMRILGFSRDEAYIYLELLQGPSTHLKLSRSTGVNRTKVYRLIDQLEKRGLVSRQSGTTSGISIAASHPAALEAALLIEEEKLNSRRKALQAVLPQLEHISSGEPRFSVRTFSGEEGFKRMLWHELRARDEVLVLGGCTLESLVSSRRWVENYRVKVTEAGYKIHEVTNRLTAFSGFTTNKLYLDRYDCRCVPEDELPLRHQISIYNDTVAMYCWRGNQSVGVEISDPPYTRMMYQLFKNYWRHSGSRLSAMR